MIKKRIDLGILLAILTIFSLDACKKEENNQDLKNPTIQNIDFDNQAIPTSYKQNFLALSFTASWCGGCPSANLQIHNSVSQLNGRLSAVMIHCSDQLATPLGDSIQSYFMVGTLPHEIYCLPNPDTISNQKFGISITSKIIGDSAQIKISTGFADNFTGYLKLVVYLTEDNISGPGYEQKDFNGIYITNYIHDFVLRKVVSTNYKGDPIGYTTAMKGKRDIKTYSIYIPTNYNKSNLKIVAYAWNGASFSSPFFNVCTSKLGQTNLWN